MADLFVQCLSTGSMSQVRLAHKQQLIIVQHDGNFCSEAAFSTLQQAINAARDSEGQAAVGLATLLGFDDACAELQVHLFGAFDSFLLF